MGIEFVIIFGGELESKDVGDFVCLLCLCYREVLEKVKV